MEPMLNHVAWVVEDQDAVADFLRTYFDCQIGDKSVIEGPWAEELAQMPGVKVFYQPAISKSTDTRIAILKFVSPHPDENPHVDELNLKGFRHIGFLVSDIDQKTADLRAGGYKFFSNPVDAKGFHSSTVYFWGPENAVIQLTEADLATPPPPTPHA
ncbi:MAG: VOC family protein [Aliishimia sp.]